MNKQLEEFAVAQELLPEELDLVAGGGETHITRCKVDTNGNGWCFLKVD